MDQRQLNFLQGNLNHSAAAQYVMIQSAMEWFIDIAVVAESYCVPARSNWAADLNGSIAIMAPVSAHSPPLSIKERGPGYVAATWGEIALVGVYFSPNRSVSDLEDWVDSLIGVVRRLAPRQIVVMGDFNAKHPAWGSTATVKGEVVFEWATTAGLSIMNRGTSNTCVRWNGASIVDLTFATPTIASIIQGWRVLGTVETLSDHVYIRFRGRPCH